MPTAKTKTKGAPSPLRAVGAWKRSKKLKLLERPSTRKELFALPLREGSADQASLYLDEARGLLAIGGRRGLEILGLATGQRSAVALGGDVARVIGCVGDTLFVRAARGLFASVDLKTAKVVATQPVEGVLSAALLDDGRLVVMTHVGTDYAGTREARVFDLRRARPEVHTFVHPGMFAPRQVSSHQGRLWIVHEGADPETTLIDTTQVIGEKVELLGRTALRTSRRFVAMVPVGEGFVASFGSDIGYFPRLHDEPARPAVLAPVALPWVHHVTSLGGSMVLACGSDKRGAPAEPIILDVASQRTCSTRGGTLTGSGSMDERAPLFQSGWLWRDGEESSLVDDTSCHFLRGDEVTFRLPTEEDTWERLVAHGEKVTALVQSRPAPRAKSGHEVVLRCFG